MKLHQTIVDAIEFASHEDDLNSQLAILASTIGFLMFKYIGPDRTLILLQDVANLVNMSAVLSGTSK